MVSRAALSLNTEVTICPSEKVPSLRLFVLQPAQPQAHLHVHRPGVLRLPPPSLCLSSGLYSNFPSGCYRASHHPRRFHTSALCHQPATVDAFRLSTRSWATRGDRTDVQPALPFQQRPQPRLLGTELLVPLDRSGPCPAASGPQVAISTETPASQVASQLRQSLRCRLRLCLAWPHRERGVCAHAEHQPTHLLFRHCSQHARANDQALVCADVQVFRHCAFTVRLRVFPFRLARSREGHSHGLTSAHVHSRGRLSPLPQLYGAQRSRLLLALSAAISTCRDTNQDHLHAPVARHRAGRFIPESVSTRALQPWALDARRRERLLGWLSTCASLHIRRASSPLPFGSTCLDTHHDSI